MAHNSDGPERPRQCRSAPNDRTRRGGRVGLREAGGREGTEEGVLRPRASTQLRNRTASGRRGASRASRSQTCGCSGRPVCAVRGLHVAQASRSTAAVLWERAHARLYVRAEPRVGPTHSRTPAAAVVGICSSTCSSTCSSDSPDDDRNLVWCAVHGLGVTCAHVAYVAYGFYAAAFFARAVPDDDRDLVHVVQHLHGRTARCVGACVRSGQVRSGLLLGRSLGP